MLTKVPSANCFSRVMTFFGLSILFSICFTLGSQASAAAESESDPLLINEVRSAPDHRVVQIEEGRGAGNLQQFLATLDISPHSAPLNAIVISPNLLASNKDQSNIAEAEMNKIILYMYYKRDDSEHEGIKSMALQGGYYVEDPSAFEAALLERGFVAITDGPLSSYLGDLNTNLVALQKVVMEQKEQIDVLNQRNTFFVRTIATIHQKESADRLAREREAAEQERAIEELQATNRKLWIALPVVVIIVGVGAVLCTHFFWPK